MEDIHIILQLVKLSKDYNNNGYISNNDIAKYKELKDKIIILIKGHELLSTKVSSSNDKVSSSNNNNIFTIGDKLYPKLPNSASLEKSNNLELSNESELHI
jgi:ABC-type Na+ transport system ATPase subunit NatA